MEKRETINPTEQGNGLQNQYLCSNPTQNLSFELNNVTNLAFFAMMNVGEIPSYPKNAQITQVVTGAIEMIGHREGIIVSPNTLAMSIHAHS